MRLVPSPAGWRRERGAGLIETMVGVTIGLIVVLVIYNLLAVSEGYKRMTTGQSDAQITGLISHFVTGHDAANGGNGLSSAYSDLINCHADGTGVKFAGREDASLKPIPVMITKGGNADASDSFISRGSASIHVVWPVPVRPQGAVKVVPPGGAIQVQSPLGFMTKTKASLPTDANPHWAVAMANNGTGRCDLIKISRATPAADMDTSGAVILDQIAPVTTMPLNGAPSNAAGTGSYLLSLGRVGDTTRVRYDINNATLRATNCMDPLGCAAPAATINPIAQNVVLMKVQFGIDTSPVLVNGTLDATVDCWTTDTEACPVNLPGPPAVAIPNWEGATLVKAGDPAFPLVPAHALNRIVAVRIGLVVRSDEPDVRDPALFVAPAMTLDGKVGTRPATNTPNATYLFNCAANTDAGCPGRVPVSSGVAPATMQNGLRYRVYEAVIPLRNSIFSATIPP
jgi:hypothetical protein